MKKNHIQLLFIFIFLFAGCSETKKENIMKKSNKLNISETNSSKKSNPNVA